MEAETLICPQCGAVVAQDSTQCQFCHAALQTVACPKCMGMMFVGTKFCPHCGAVVAAVDRTQGSNFTCPRCEIKLTDVMIGDTPLDECARCGGLWIAVVNFERICSTAEDQEAATGLRLPPPVEINQAVRYLKCPQCANLMSRMNYASRSGIIISVCRPHGIWLDRDEIRQIVEFIRAGGLDRARNAELQELQEARRQDAEPTSIEPVVDGYRDASRESFAASDHAQLLKGIASLANHFLGA